MDNALEVKGLTKKYGEFTAVKGIDFSVLRGEIFGFLGPNGAGKTTTINMLTGLARVSAGTFNLVGYGPRQIKKAQQFIGIVPDESNLYEEMDGFDNLCFCAALYGLPKVLRAEKAKRLLKQFGLEEAGNRPFKANSKGMKRKLTIAAGIIHDPKILFLDEPTTGIDVASARQIRKLILELNKSGTTIFLTTHYIEEAERLCHRIAFIVDGNFIRFPMLFLCGLFIPVSQLPVFLRPLAYALPLTYGADLLKASINNAGQLPLWLNYVVLICFTIFLFSFSIINVLKKWLL